MQKYILTAITFFFCHCICFSQAALPTTYDFLGFNGSIPINGWSTNITGIFEIPMPCNVMQGGKLDAQGEYIQVEFNGIPNSIGFEILPKRGLSDTAWVGLFKIEESNDGIVWKTIDSLSYMPLPLPTFCDYAFNNLNSQSKFVRMILHKKVGGNTINLTDIYIDGTTPTSINKIDSHIDGYIFPNPISSHFNLKAEINEPIFRINVYSILGGLLLSIPTPLNNQSITLPAQISNGQYLVELLSEKKIFRQRILVNR